MRLTLFTAAILGIIGGAGGLVDSAWALLGALLVIYLFIDFAEQSSLEAQNSLEGDRQAINFQTATYGPAFPEPTATLEDGHVHFLQEEDEVKVFIWNAGDQCWVLTDDVEYQDGTVPKSLATIIE